MKNFQFRFNEEAYGYIGFSAKSMDDAEEWFEKFRTGEISEEDLPNYWKSHLDGQNDYEDLEEITK